MIEAGLAPNAGAARYLRGTIAEKLSGELVTRPTQVTALSQRFRLSRHLRTVPCQIARNRRELIQSRLKILDNLGGLATPSRWRIASGMVTARYRLMVACADLLAQFQPPGIVHRDDVDRCSPDRRNPYYTYARISK